MSAIVWRAWADSVEVALALDDHRVAFARPRRRTGRRPSRRRSTVGFILEPDGLAGERGARDQQPPAGENLASKSLVAMPSLVLP